MKKWVIILIFSMLCFNFGFTQTTERYDMRNAISDGNPVHFGDTVQLKSLHLRNYFAITDQNIFATLNSGEINALELLKPSDQLSTLPISFNSLVLIKSSDGEKYVTQNESGQLILTDQSSPALWVVKNPNKLNSTDTVKNTDIVYFEKYGTKDVITGIRSGDNAPLIVTQSMTTFSSWILTKEGPLAEPTYIDNVQFGDAIKIKSADLKGFLISENTLEVKTPVKNTFTISGGNWEIICYEQPASHAGLVFGDKVQIYSTEKGVFLASNASNQLITTNIPDATTAWQIYHSNGEGIKGNVEKCDIISLKSVKNQFYLASNLILKKTKGPESDWYLSSDDYLKNWMTWTDELSNKPLRDITFPASHDTATWEFLDEIAPNSDSKDLRFYMTNANAFIDAFDSLDLPYTDYDLDLPETIINKIRDAAMKAFYKSSRDLAQCTYQDAGNQLESGIRWMDLRPYLRDGGSYTHHFLTAVEMIKVIQDVSAFLDETRGEIVVLELTHFIPESSNAVDARYNALVDLMISKFGDHIYQKTYDSEGLIINNPLNVKYKEFVGSPATSKVILITDGEPVEQTTSPYFWNYAQLGLTNTVDNYGYADSTGKLTMLTDQKIKYNLAVASKEPYTLWYTLTCQVDEALTIEVNAISRAVISCIADAGITNVLYNSLPDWVFDDALDYIKEYLPDELSFLSDEAEELNYVKKKIKEYISSFVNKYVNKINIIEPEPDYETTHDLTTRVNPTMHIELNNQFQSVSSGDNRIMVIYGDFTNESNLIETAIQYSRLNIRKVH